MYIIGIDFSINYPSACISNNFKDFKFLSVINDKKVSLVKKSFIIDKSDLYTDITIKTTNSDRNIGTEYHVKERNKLVNAIELVNKLVIETKKNILNEKAIVAIEGIAYGAKGNSLVDICQVTGIVRKELLDNILSSNVNNFFVISPSEMKQSIGLKGNADKTQIFNKFLDDPMIDAVKESHLHKFLSEHRNHDYVFNGKEVASPWNDMIDAYLAVLSIYNSLL